MNDALRTSGTWLRGGLVVVFAVLQAAAAHAAASPGNPCGVESTPPSGPPAVVVQVSGDCYPLHSGRSASVYLDDRMIGRVSGETGGNFRNLVRIPADAAPGPHELRVEGQGLLSTIPFEVTHPHVCVGDCDRNGLVTVDELMTGVAINLGEQPFEACDGFDADWDARVGVDELIAGIATSLAGCTPAPDLFGFAGAYTVAISDAENFAPGAVQIFPGLITGGNRPAFLIDVTYFPGVVRASTTGHFDSLMGIGGEFVRVDGWTSDVTGQASAVTDDTSWWISGTMTFRPVSDGRDEMIYFVMTRRAD